MKQHENAHSSVLHCSFCDKRRDQVEHFIAGPRGIFIRDECVELCWEIIRAKRLERKEVLDGPVERVSITQPV